MRIIISSIVLTLACSSMSAWGQTEWTDLRYDQVTAYFVRHPLIEEEIIENGKLNAKLDSSNVVTLSSAQIRKVNRILTKRDRPGEYSVMECFLPRHGLVFWDEKRNPIAWVSVCFECNQIKASPDLNKSDLKDFKLLFKNIGFPVHENHEGY